MAINPWTGEDDPYAYDPYAQYGGSPEAYNVAQPQPPAGVPGEAQIQQNALEVQGKAQAQVATSQKPRGFDANALRQALSAYNVPASAAALKQFIDAHPEFATGVRIGGSKNNKLWGPNGEYLADVIVSTDGPNPTWGWDTGTGANGGGGSLGALAVDPSYLQPWTQEFSDPSPVPGYRPPPAFEYEGFQSPGAFQAPTADTILQDPSYQFRADQGRGMLENSAAARGVLNSGGTLNDILQYGQQFASQEYSNIWDRNFNLWNTNYDKALNTYNTNRGNALGNWATNYGVGKDTYDMASQASNTNYDRAWQSYLDEKNSFYANQSNPFQKLYNVASLGAGVA